MKVVLIPCGTTEWRQQGRLLGRVELSLSESGHQQTLEWVEMLRDVGVGKIFHSPDELATTTAKILANALDVPTKSDSELCEVDIGLWAGLTEAELKSRYAKAHRQLVEAPLHVSPPGGESVGDAAKRLREGLKKRLKRNGKKAVGLVMRPFAFALARNVLGESEANCIWNARQADTPIIVDYEPAQSAATKA